MHKLFPLLTTVIKRNGRIIGGDELDLEHDLGDIFWAATERKAQNHDYILLGLTILNRTLLETDCVLTRFSRIQNAYSEGISYSYPSKPSFAQWCYKKMKKITLITNPFQHDSFFDAIEHSYFLQACQLKPAFFDWITPYTNPKVNIRDVYPLCSTKPIEPDKNKEVYLFEEFLPLYFLYAFKADLARYDIFITEKGVQSPFSCGCSVM